MSTETEYKGITIYGKIISGQEALAMETFPIGNTYSGNEKSIKFIKDLISLNGLSVKIDLDDDGTSDTVILEIDLNTMSKKDIILMSELIINSKPDEFDIYDESVMRLWWD